MRNRFAIPMSAAMFLAAVAEAQAYVGPGVGLTLVGTFIGLLATVFCAVGAILAWPLRRMLRRRRERKRAAGGAADGKKDAR